MQNFSYIFINRNFGNDYAYALPPMGWLRHLIWQYLIEPQAKAALMAKENQLRCNLSKEEFRDVSATGISVHTYCHKHTVYSVKITPDTLCPDKRAVGRSPHFIMHLLVPGLPEVLSKRFSEFRAHCQDIAWHTMRSGVLNELKIVVPDDLYP